MTKCLLQYDVLVLSLKCMKRLHGAHIYSKIEFAIVYTVYM